MKENLLSFPLVCSYKSVDHLVGAVAKVVSYIRRTHILCLHFCSLPGPPFLDLSCQSYAA